MYKFLEWCFLVNTNEFDMKLTKVSQARPNFTKKVFLKK